MIDDVLNLLKSQLSNYLVSVGLGEVVDYPEFDQKVGQIKFKAETVNLLLYRIEKEGALGQQGSPAHPVMNINLNILFVANFASYVESLHHLSQVIQFFQTNRRFDPQNAPDMPAGLRELAVDIITFDFAGQSYLWQMLAAGYQPSVAYLVKTVAFGGQEASFAAPISKIDASAHSTVLFPGNAATSTTIAAGETPSLLPLSTKNGVNPS
ncbi:MAG: DUF4255 domain-containing protein [Proteobacteria bacterium]|nr:DUF4255 domain-containing protein [Pseudomonadota bacterium]